MKHDAPVVENTHFHGNNYFIEAIETENKVEALVMVDVGQQKVKMKLDTGAEISVLPNRVYKELVNRGEKIKLSSTDTKLMAYGGTEIPVIGKCNLNCTVKNISRNISFIVVESSSRTILGFNACKSLSLVRILCEIEEKNSRDDVTVEPQDETYEETHTVADTNEGSKKACKKVKTPKQEKQRKLTVDEKVKIINKLEGNALREKIVELYPKVFNGIGKLDTPHKIQLKADSRPVIHAPRKIPVTVRERLRTKLCRRDAKRWNYRQS